MSEMLAEQPVPYKAADKKTRWAASLTALMQLPPLPRLRILPHPSRPNQKGLTYHIPEIGSKKHKLALHAIEATKSNNSSLDRSATQIPVPSLAASEPLDIAPPTLQNLSQSVVVTVCHELPTDPQPRCELESQNHFELERETVSGQLHKQHNELSTSNSSATADIYQSLDFIEQSIDIHSPSPHHQPSSEIASTTSPEDSSAVPLPTLPLSNVPRDQFAQGDVLQVASTASPKDSSSVQISTSQSNISRNKTEQEANPHVEFSGFQKLGGNCYVATKIHVDKTLQVEFDRSLRRSLSALLMNLKLKDARISLECAMIGSKDSLAAMKPTILFMCFSGDQKKAITKAIIQTGAIPTYFQYKVLIFEVKKSSGEGETSASSHLAGHFQVEATLSGEIPTLCGVLSRILDPDKVDEYTISTIGGLIVVNDSLFALTTAHGFASSQKTTITISSTKAGNKDAIDSSLSTKFATPIRLGHIHSYAWTGDDEHVLLADGYYSESQDWALITLPGHSVFTNTIQGYMEGKIIEGHIRSEDLDPGEVFVCCGISGFQRGVLNGGMTSIIMGSSLFEVRSIFLEHELGDGDSGSWVVRDGKLCGYIFCRVKGLPWAYMLPIEPVFRWIKTKFFLDGDSRVGLPSAKELEKASHSHLPATKIVSQTTLPDTELLIGEMPAFHQPQSPMERFLQEPLPVTFGNQENIEVTEEKEITNEKEPNSPRKGKIESPKSLNTSKEDAEYPSGAELGLISLALYLSMFIIAMENTIIATAIPNITDEFNTLADIGWYGSAYLFTASAFQMPFDKFYKIFSIKWVYLSAILISGVGSLICGVAPNSTALVIGRAIAGVGSPGVSLGAYIIFAHSVPLRQRIKYNAFIGVSHGIGFVAGPLLGGLFNEKATWRWCFYVKLPIGGIIAGIIVIVFRVPDRAKAASMTWKQRLGKLDLVGTLFFVSAIVCLLIALQWGGPKYEWNNARIISLFVLFAILIAVFFFEQYRVGEKATVPPRILKHRSVAAACWYAFCMRSAFLIMVYYLPVWFQAVQGVSAVQSGIRNLPLVLGLIIVSILSIIGVSIQGVYAPWMIASSIVMAIGSGLVITFKPDTSTSMWIGYQAMCGIGGGLGIQQPLLAIQTTLNIADVQTGTSVIIFLQNLGGALFVSVAQNLFTNKLQDGLAEYAPNLDPAIILRNGATSFQSTLSGDSLTAVTLAYNNALVRTFILSTALASFSLLGAVLIDWKSTKSMKKAEHNVEAAPDAQPEPADVTEAV